MNFYRILLFVAAGMVITGCAQVGGIKPAGLLNPVVSYNGQQFRVATRADFQQGRFADLPRPESLADLNAMDESIHRLVSAMKIAKARKDVEAVAVMQGMATRLLDYRAHITASSVKAYRDTYQTGYAGLEAGAYAILPAFDRYGSGTAYSAALPPAPRVLLAANGGTDLLKNVVSGETKRAFDEYIKKNTPAKAMPFPALPGMSNYAAAEKSAFPEGVPYVGTTTSGQEFVVERSGDSLILHNPGKAPVKIGLEKLGYVPRLPMPPLVQQQAAPIMKAMSASARFALIELKWHGRNGFKSPNVIISRNGEKAYINQHGLIGDAISGATAYRTMPEYRFAADAVEKMHWSNQVEEFLSNCANTLRAQEMGGFGSSGHQGKFAEIVGLTCVANGITLYDKTYFTTKNGLLQTWGSQLKDEATRKEVEKSLLMRDAMELGIGMVPVAGNLDALSSCKDGSSLVEKTLRINSETYRNSETLAGFVGVDNDDSAFERGLSCLATLPLLNNLKALRITPEKAAKLYGVSSEAMERAFKVSSLFETNASPKAIAEQFKLVDGMNSASAKKLAKGLLDTANTGGSISDMSQSLGFALDIYGG